MDPNNLWIEFVTYDDDTGLIIANDDGGDGATLLFKKQSQTFNMDARQTFSRAKILWGMVGTYVKSVTYKPLNNIPTWGDLAFPGLSMSLKEFRTYDDPDVGEAEESTYNEWDVELSIPFDQVPGAIEEHGSFGSGFEALLVSKLYDMGFQYPSPPWPHSPTGFMFTDVVMKTSDDRTLITVINHWQRDV